MKPKLLFIINPVSGTVDKQEIEAAIDQYADHDKFVVEKVYTAYAGHAAELSRQAATDGVAIVVAVGGDGTVNEVGKGLVYTDTALGILPCGSGNGLARHLLLPMNVRKCIEIINAAEIHRLDYGTINDYPFFCTCGMGFDAFISEQFAKAGKRGPITYVQKVLEAGLKYRPQTYVLSVDGSTMQYKAFLISVANASQYGNNCYIAPQASMSDGLLDVVIMEPFDMMDAPQISLDLFNKTLDKNSKIKTFQTKHIHVCRQQEGVIHYDGEPVMTGREIDIMLHEKGISMVVNPWGNPEDRKPNVIQTAAADLFAQMHAIREDLQKQTQRGIRLTRMLQRKVTRW